MTETRFTWRWLIVVGLAGILVGLAVGLMTGWLIVPQTGTSSIASLSAAEQNEYIILVANTYAFDQDLDKAKIRLAQLQDLTVESRVERLAKALATRGDPAAANVAELAVALGSEDSSLQVMAQSVAGVGNDALPTKYAMAEGPVTATPGADSPQVEPTATKKKKDKPTAVPTEEPAPDPTEPPATQAPTAPKPTQAPRPTAVPTQPPAAPALMPDFIPAFPDLWWDSVKFIPAQVAPGQQYWRLKYARYCDWAPNDNFETCPGFPGGGMGTIIYIMTVDEGGNCITTDVTDEINDGSRHPLTTDMLKTISYPWNPYGYACDKDYEKEMYGEGNSISVPGLPSDKITELSLCAKNPPPGHNPPPCGHAHVRYFLIFQRTTR